MKWGGKSSNFGALRLIALKLKYDDKKLCGLSLTQKKHHEQLRSRGRVIDTDITWKWDVGPNTWYKIWIFPQCWVKAVKGTKHSVLWSAQFPWEHSGEFTQNIYTTFSFQQNTDRSPLTLCFQPFSFRWSVTFTFNSTFLLYLFCYRMHFCGKLSRTSASADAF